MSQATMKNGVNVDDLMAAVEAVKSDPANGKLTFTVTSKWENGFKATHTTSSFAVGGEAGSREKEHSLSTDEPNQILGSDKGISPAETLISALAACLTVGYAANAAAMGIDLEELSFEITGNGSLEGFMNIGNKRAGLSDLSIKTFVKSDAPKEKISELHNYTNEHSPIWDTICNPVSITSEVVTG
ncbi:MAG: OsmC family protein [Candidatus Krumholzibacteriota bacterium]